MNRFAIRFLGAVLVALLFAGCQSDEEKLAEHMKRGDAYVEDGSFDEAIIEYMGVLQIDPNNADAHYKLAKAYFETDKVRQGYWELRETVRLDPSNVDAKIELAMMLYYAKEFEEALVQVDAAIAAEPENAKAHAIRGQILDALNRSDEALEAIARALEIEPDRREMMMLYATALANRGLDDEAEKMFQRLTEQYPAYRTFTAWADFIARSRDTSRDEEVVGLYRKAIEAGKPDQVPKAYSKLANFYYSRDRADDAIQVLEEGIEKSDEKLELIYALARFHNMLGNKEKASELIEQATSAAPEEARPYMILSAHRDRNGDLEGALEAAQKAAEIEPENVDASLRVTEVIVEMGVKNDDAEKIAEGRRRVETLLESEPEKAAALVIKAKIDIYEKKFDDAVAALRSAINARPDWAQAHFVLGTALALSGDHTGARSELARALELDATLVAARRVLAQVHADLRENEYAVEEGRRYLRERPGDRQIRILVAQSLIRLGKADEALAELNAVPESERNIEINYAYGRIYMGKGNYDAARQFLLAALEEQPTNNEVLNSLYLLDRATESDTSDIVARIQAASEEDPENARLQLLLANIALSEKRGEDAEAGYKKAIELDPDDLKAYESLARYYSATGRLQEAIDTYEAAVARRPKAAQLYHLLGVLYELGGEREKAIENYEEAIRYAPNLGEAKNNLAYMYAESERDLDRALELAQEAKALLPDNSNAADTLGWVLYKRGVPGAAISYLREAEATSEPGSPTLGLVRYHLALAYKSKGDDAEAAKTLERALADLDAHAAEVRARGATVQEPEWATEARAMLEQLGSSSS